MMKRNLIAKTFVLIGSLSVLAYLQNIGYINAAVIPPKLPTVNGFMASLFGKDVVLVTGRDFKTGQPIVANPLTGDEVPPCNIQSDIQTSNSTGCQTAVIDAPSEIASAIRASNQIFQGTINKNGKTIEARFVVTVTALYEGSSCVTEITAGKQYEYCTSLQRDCTFLLPLTRYGNKTEDVRKNVRKACGLPSAGTTVPTPTWRKNWLTQDCKNLKLVYNKNPAVPATPVDPAVDYSAAYENYIKTTCKTMW